MAWFDRDEEARRVRARTPVAGDYTGVCEKCGGGKWEVRWHADEWGCFPVGIRSQRWWYFEHLHYYCVGCGWECMELVSQRRERLAKEGADGRA